MSCFCAFSHLTRTRSCEVPRVSVAMREERALLFTRRPALQKRSPCTEGPKQAERWDELSHYISCSSPPRVLGQDVGAVGPSHIDFRLFSKS